MQILFRLLLALQFAVAGALPAQARMSYDYTGSGKLNVPGPRLNGRNYTSAPIIPTPPVAAFQLQKWKDALAAAQAGTKSARMIVFGGDDAVGNTTTTVGAQPGSWPQLVGNAYAQQGYSVNTNSFFGNKNASAVNPYGAAGATYDPRLTTTGVTLAGPSSAGLGNFPFNLTTSASAMAWAPTGQTDTTEIFYTKDATSAVGFVNVDGGANTAVARSGNGVGLGKITLNYTRGASHVINIGWTSGTFQIIGAISYDSTVKEVQIVNLAIQQQTWAEATWSSNAVSPFGYLNNIAQLGGDLWVMQQSQGDETSNIPINTARAGYGIIASHAKDVGADLLFITGNPWDTTLTNMAQVTQQSYADYWKAFAANMSAPVIDLFGYNGTYATQNTAGRQATARFRNAAGHAYDAAYIKAQIDNILTLPALSPPTPQTYDVADVASLNALNPVPGSTVRLARGTTYAGPITLPWVGTPDAPIVLTTTGATTSPATITGTPSPSTASPNYVDAVTITGSNIRVDGGIIDGQKLGLVVRDTGRAAFYKNPGTLGLDVLRTEMVATGSGVSHNGRKGRYAGNYIRDMVIVKNTDGGVKSPPTQVAGEPSATAWDDDDYGANPFIISGSDVEMAWNRVARDIAPSFDYGTDGGALELFPLYGYIENIWFHDNWVEGGDGVLEGGASTGSGAGIRNLRVNGNIALNNFGFAALHNSGGSFEGLWDQIDVSYNTIVEENNTMSTRQTIILDGQGTGKLNGFLTPNYGFRYNIIQINSGDAIFKQANTTYHSNNVFNLLNNQALSGAAGITHLNNDYTMTLGTGESFATPGFVNQAARNFALNGGSPAAGKGHTAWTPVALLGVSSYPADYNKPTGATATTTTLAADNTAPASGTPVVLTATVAPSAATGVVTFNEGATALGTGSLSSGTASYTTSGLSSGAHNITATYGGDSTYSPSTSGTTTVTVSAAITGNSGQFASRKAFRSGALISSNVTLLQMVTAEAPFTRVRLGYVNQTSTDLTISKAVVAPSSTAAADGFTPTNSSGAADFTLFKPITFNGGQTTGTVPAIVAPGNQNTVVSDWIDLASLPRTDGGTLPVLMSRSYSSGPAHGAAPSTAAYNDLFNGETNRIIKVAFKAGDQVTTPSAMTSVSAGLYVAPDYIEVQTVNKGATILSVGDSRTQGVGSVSSSDGYRSAEHFAANTLSSVSRPVTFMNGGFGGATSAQYLANGRRYFDAALPDITVIETWTPNDTGSAATDDSGYQGALSLAAYIKSQGKKAVLRTPYPASDSGTVRASIISRLKAQTDYPIIDYDAVMSNGASPPRMVTAAGSPDSIHSGLAGYRDIMAPVAVQVLGPIINSLP